MKFPRDLRLALLCTAALALLGACSKSPSDENLVRIGHVGPISGPQAHYGKDNENGVRMAIDDLNAAHVVIAGKPIHFEIVAEDDAADPKQGTDAAQKLCDEGVNGVVGHMNSGTTIPAAKIYHDCGIPHITPSATNPDLTKPGYNTTYRLLANDNALGEGLANYAGDTLKLKRVAVIDDRTAYGTGIANVFKKTAVAKGIEIVDEQYTNDKAVDFKSILTAIKAKHPDAIFFGGMDPQAGAMLRQMQELGMDDMHYFGGDGLCTVELANKAAHAATLKDVVCAVGGAALERMPQGIAWKKRYDEKFPGQFQVYSAYCYDATMVLVDAMKRAGSTDPKVYVSKLPETDYQGVSGHIQFTPKGELRAPAITLYHYVDNKREALP